MPCRNSRFAVSGFLSKGQGAPLSRFTSKAICRERNIVPVSRGGKSKCSVDAIGSCKRKNKHVLVDLTLMMVLFFRPRDGQERETKINAQLRLPNVI